VIDVLVDGRAPVEWTGLEVAYSGAVELSADADLDGVPSVGDRAVPLNDGILRLSNGTEKRVLSRPESLLPGLRAQQRLEPEALAYRFFLRANQLQPDSIRLNLQNGITSVSVTARSLPLKSALPASSSVHPWSLREPPSLELSLEGEVRLSKNLEVPRNTTLRIAAGTHLVLEPDVSIHCQGRIEALGSEEQPITIESSDPRRPFGSIALLGAGADNSRFEHVRFSGGGGALLDEVEYTGMVCVHWASGVRFEHCEFSANQRCDDALHADVADVSLAHCWFHDTNADAIDYDISTGTIEHCKIERAGNDGFDLMTCAPTIRDAHLLDFRPCSFERHRYRDGFEATPVLAGSALGFAFLCSLARRLFGGLLLRSSALLGGLLGHLLRCLLCFLGHALAPS
jgi:hypothetical protein